ELAGRGSPDQPGAFDQNERSLLPNDSVSTTGLRLEIVAREARWPAGARGHDPFLKQGPINCPRMIKVNSVAARDGKFTSVTIEIVQGNRSSLIVEMLFQAGCDPAFAGAAPPDDCDEPRRQWVYHTAALSVAKAS